MYNERSSRNRLELYNPRQVEIILTINNKSITLNTYKFGLMSRVFTDGLRDRGSISGRVIPKTQKMVFDVALLNTQPYKVRIKGKVEQSRKWGSALPYTSV